ncbi:MAG: amidohydrolase family protein [Armatimonadota bacterium]
MRGWSLWLTSMWLLCLGNALDKPASSLAPVYEASRERPVRTKGVYAIVNATVHPISAPPIEWATVLIRDGRIEAVGKEVTVPPDAEVYNAQGLHLYPGFIDASTTLGLVEIGAVSATVDTAETGSFNPNARVEIAINPDSELIPVARVNGITTAVVAPSGGVLSGMGCVINLDGWTWEDMCIKSPLGIYLNFPAPSGDASQSAEARRRDWESRMRPLRDFFENARRYARARSAEGKEGVPIHERDPRFEAMLPVLEGKLPLFVRVESALGIQAAIRWAEEEKVRLVIVGGSEAWKVADLLREKGVPVILERVHALPRTEDAPYDQPFITPKLLHEKGVLFCIASADASNVRNLPYHAATAVAFGLPHAEGLKALTLYPARILGLEHRLGSIEPGKDANLILTTGDPLDIRTEVRQVWIGGRPIEMSSKHLRLYEKYRRRPN